MEQCRECKWSYPDELVSPMTVGRPGSSPKRVLVCGICALRISNELHGLSRDSFTGTEAERLRQQAIQWRKKHSQEGRRDANQQA